MSVAEIRAWSERAVADFSALAEWQARAKDRLSGSGSGREEDRLRVPSYGELTAAFQKIVASAISG